MRCQKCKINRVSCLSSKVQLVQLVMPYQFMYHGRFHTPSCLPEYMICMHSIHAFDLA